MKNKTMNVRAAAAQVSYLVVDKGHSLSSALPHYLMRINSRDSALLQEICYGVLRYLPSLEACISNLVQAPLKGKLRPLHHLLLVGVYQLRFMRIPDHAAVSETVQATIDLQGAKMRNLINAVLRNYQRDQENLNLISQNHDAIKYNHPNWLIKQLSLAYPDKWQDILIANNQKAPMWIRVNSKHNTRDHYQQMLLENGINSFAHPFAKDALKLEKPIDVNKLIGFDSGWVSVQDGAAQLAVEYLKPQDGELILDCCAAPGGKTAHILERTTNARVIAVDNDKERLKRVYENLERLNLTAQVFCADASKITTWWHQEKFDRILLDAPCSATGVIRRHPGIKWLRKSEDINKLATLQSKILDKLWQHLKLGGTLVYATCSILPLENSEQIKAFIDRTIDAQLVDLQTNAIGRQILPDQDAMDGFYYAVLYKTNGS